MAEKYGTKPKRFTAAWWEYFWMYYKWHTIITAFIIIATVCTIHSMITAEKFDLTLTYAGNNSFSEAECQRLEDVLSPFCEDIDKNGEKSLLFSAHQTVDSRTNPEYFAAVTTKLYVSFGEEDCYAFILNKELADSYAGEAEDDCMFAPLVEWLDGDIPQDSVYTAHGKGYGIDLSRWDIFKETGIDFSGHYLFVRKCSGGKDDATQLRGYNATVAMINKLLQTP